MQRQQCSTQLIGDTHGLEDDAAQLANAAGAAPIPAVLGATLGASFGFMMPISTAPNALAYATGKVSMGQMIRTGIVFDVVGFILIVGGLRIICPLMGWT